MTSYEGSRCCCSFIFTLGLTALFMWLSLRVSNPKCSLHFFYLPAIDKTLNSTANSTLSLMIQFQNPNKDKGIKYDAVNVTVHGGVITSTVAATTIPRFRQGNKKKARKWVRTNTTAAALRAVSRNGTAVFRVGLATRVRFKILLWYTPKHTIRVAAEFLVNNGTQVGKKGVKLKSLSPPPPRGSCLAAVVAFFNFLVWVLLDFSL